jgi:myo-inositol-1(or 4)-monophosphatase
MEPAELLELFERVGVAVRDALAPLIGDERRARTSRRGQYAIDLLADAAALRELRGIGLAIVSEESGRTGPPDAAIAVVLDPVDGSSNAARGLPYWATSLCALDADGPLAGLVVNQATGVTVTAVRGMGAWRDGRTIHASGVTRVEDSLVALSALPIRVLPWKQFRVLGSCALALCDVAAGSLDAFVDGAAWHAPWDYLGGLLACREAGATVCDRADQPLEITAVSARRQILAAATPELLAAVRPAVDD